MQKQFDDPELQSERLESAGLRLTSSLYHKAGLTSIAAFVLSWLVLGSVIYSVKTKGILTDLVLGGLQGAAPMPYTFQVISRGLLSPQ